MSQNNTKGRFNPTKYLLSLNVNARAEEILLPAIGEDDLKALEENDNPIVIAHDWFSQSAYEFGAFGINKGTGRIGELQSINGSKIVNDGGEYIFECGSLDHKGLIAIEVPKGSLYFVMEKRIELPDEENDYRSVMKLYFEPDTPQEYMDEVISLVSQPDIELTVVKDQWLSLYADDFKNIQKTLPVKLI